MQPSIHFGKQSSSMKTNQTQSQSTIAWPLLLKIYLTTPSVNVQGMKESYLLRN